MIKFIDVTGKTEDEAIQSALAQLGMDRDDVSVEILERAKAGFLGIGSAPARVRVSYDDGKAEEAVKPAEKPAAPKPEKKVEPSAAPKAVPMYAPEVLQKKEPRAAKEERSGRPAREERRERAPRAERAERPAPQPKPIVDLGEECRDEKSEQIRSFLKGLLEHMDSAAEIKIYESEKGRYKVYLEGEKLGALIGRRGETLDAIQQLTNYSINRGSEKNRVRVQVDAENYREKREQSLERLAEKVAGKVTKYRRNVTLEPMNAYERHVIHTALQDTPGVTTFSIGTEPNRRVVVSYDRTKA
ncbi:MAG: RNA-binding cell elongation regulator Jag/EloR [Oscillospiraceae bacterium]|nr:RNA-binding cell elongation regulator Jag/EloR [Oscillospiraceae bacterium]